MRRPMARAGKRWISCSEGIIFSLVFYHKMKLRFALPGLALLAAILAACSSAPSAATAGSGRTPAAGEPEAWKSLAKDMTADQVRAALGQPVEVRPMQQAGAEVWVYRRMTARDVGMVPTKMEDIPYFDPFTGEQRTIQEPVYSQEVRTVEEELHLLLYEGKLVNWKSRFLGARTYQEL